MTPTHFRCPRHNVVLPMADYDRHCEEEHSGVPPTVYFLDESEPGTRVAFDQTAPARPPITPGKHRCELCWMEFDTPEDLADHEAMEEEVPWMADAFEDLSADA